MSDFFELYLNADELAKLSWEPGLSLGKNSGRAPRSRKGESHG
jgi:hypothetical protein